MRVLLAFLAGLDRQGLGCRFGGARLPYWRGGALFLHGLHKARSADCPTAVLISAAGVAGCPSAPGWAL